MKVAYLKNWLEDRPLDLKYLGQRLPGTPEERQELLAMFRNILERNGPEYVRKHRGILLAGAKDILIDL